VEIAKLFVNVSDFDANDAAFNDRSKGAALTFSGGKLPMAFISRSWRHSATDLITKVTSASKANKDATAKAATDWYSLYKISTCKGIVLVCPRM
jgi:hypothetical protein